MSAAISSIVCDLNVAKYVYEQLEPKLSRGIKLEAVRVVEEPGCSAKFSG